PSVRYTMEKSEFDRLLERYLNDDVTEQEREKIEAWLEISKTKGDIELSREAEDRLFRKITGNLDNLDELVASARPRKRVDVSQWILRIAAVVLLVAVVAYGLRYLRHEYRTEESVVTTRVDKLILNDGSLVWL